MTYDASSPRDVARAKRRAKAVEHREREDMRWVLRDERGRRLLYGLMEANYLNEDIPIGSSETYLNLGKRAVALAIRRLVLRVADHATLAAMAAEWHSPPEGLPDDPDRE